MAATVRGYIAGYDGETLTILAPFDNSRFLQDKEVTECTVQLSDGRSITPAQRRKIFALVSDIGDFVTCIRGKREYVEMLRQLQLLYLIDSADNETIRRQLTLHFCGLMDMDVFSLSNVDKTTAREFIDWLVELCVRWDIPCNDTLLNRCEDIGRYLYVCVAQRRCAICGGKADIHEVEKVGAGRNRVRIHHLRQQVQPLCRRHHVEAETIGQQSFDRKYHMQSIRLDEYLCKCIGWKQ